MRIIKTLTERGRPGTEASNIYRITLSIQNSVLYTPCRLHPASNGNSISESHLEYEGHAHHYVITITSSRGPNGGSSALPRPSSYTAAPRRTAPGPSNLCPSYLTTLITIHSSCIWLFSFFLKYVKDRCDELERSASHFLGPTDHF